MVVAPSLIPIRAGDRVKTDRRDALPLARLLAPASSPRSGCPTRRWRRCAGLASSCRAFLLRHNRIYTGRSPWRGAHRRWLAAQCFEHPAQQIVLQELIDTIADAETRRDRLNEQIEELARTWALRPLVEALQAMRGIAFLSAVVSLISGERTQRIKLTAGHGGLHNTGSDQHLMSRFEAPVPAM